MQDTSQNVPLPEIPQGEDYAVIVEYVDDSGVAVNLTDYTAKSQFRQTIESTGDPIISLTTNDGSIVINELAGTITLMISREITATLTPFQVIYYDLFIYDESGIATRLIQGTVVVSGSVTR